MKLFTMLIINNLVVIFMNNMNNKRQKEKLINLKRCFW